MAWRLISVKQCNAPARSSGKSIVYDGPTESPSLGGGYEPTLEETVPSWEEEPAPYFLAEMLALRNRNQEDIRQVHKAKLAYPGVRLIQEATDA